MDSIELYINLRNDIERWCRYLHILHGKNIMCCEKCSSCCTNLTVYPVELAALKRIAEEKKIPTQETVDLDYTVSCVFLRNDLCSVYAVRPVICLTHGLPVMYTDDAHKTAVSYCEKNFLSEPAAFTGENTLPLDSINEKLYLINRRYIQENMLDISSDSRVSFSALCEPHMPIRRD